MKKILMKKIKYTNFFEKIQEIFIFQATQIPSRTIKMFLKRI